MLDSVELNQIPLAALPPGLWSVPFQFILPVPSDHVTTPPHPWLGGWEGRALNSCWPRMCFPSTSINWEEPWVVNPGSGTTQRSLFAITQTTAGTPAWGDAAWWGRINVWACPSSLHREVQGPRLQVSCLDHTAHALWISGGKTTSSL